VGTEERQVDSQTSELAGLVVRSVSPHGDRLPEPTKVVGSGVGEPTSDESLVLARATELGETAERIAAERGRLRDGRLAIRTQGDDFRERQNGFLSQCAIVVALASAAGLDRHPPWCRDLATALGARWTGMSDRNPRAALVRVVARGQVSADTARNAARAIDAVLARSGDDLVAMSLEERETAIGEIFSRGVHHVLNGGAARPSGSRPSERAGGLVLVGPGLDLLQPGQRRRAVIEKQEDGTVTLTFVAAQDMRVMLERGPAWADRKWPEIKGAAKGACWAGVGEEARIDAPAVPSLLRLVEDGTITAEHYYPGKGNAS
jgi:hypothetical protein